MVWYLQFWPHPSNEKYPKQEQKYPQNTTNNGTDYDTSVRFLREADIRVIETTTESVIYIDESLKIIGSSTPDFHDLDY